MKTVTTPYAVTFMFALIVMTAFSVNISADDAEIIAELRTIPASTISDAVEQATGKSGFMKHDMRPMANTERMAGRAKTVQIAPAPTTTSPGASHSVQTIDSSGPGDVVVIKGTSLDIACIGGLMANAVKLLGIEGVVIDGGARDIKELEELGVKVYARSITPSTGVGKQTSLSGGEPVVCGGVTVTPGDYIVADYDGVVRIPADSIDDVLDIARGMEAKEKQMVPKMKELKSLGETIRIFKRL